MEKTRLKYIIVLVSLFFMYSCTPKHKYESLLSDYESLKKDYELLKRDNDSLINEIEKYETSPEQLMESASNYIKTQDTINLEKILQTIITYHPAAPERQILEKKIDNIKKECYEQKVKERNKRLSAVKKLRKKYDDVSGITWYYNPYFVHYNSKNLTSIYIGQQDNSVWLRLKMSYSGDNWIFFKNAYLSYDGNTKEIYFDEYRDKKTEVDYGVEEWIDVPVNSSILTFLENMVNGKTVKMRLSGKYTHTRNLSNDEIKGIRDVLLAYDVLIKEKYH